jgi:hypothetical protein
MRRALAVLLPLAAVLALVLWRMPGPPAQGADAPANEFSSARAMATLRTILSENVPHPVGTPANQRVRARLEARFRELGYETFVQRKFVCNARAVCASVENVIARLPGEQAPRDVVLLAAHYDSVPAGPGVSDDGMGVGTMLEVARAIRNERFANRIWFLIDDGEEAGLLGAEAFVADEALAKDVEVVINVEMRGTYGASNLFETSRGNRWLIRHAARAIARPQASSLFYTIYDMLPNDTDVTVFKRANVAALNFAAIRGVQWYHTPLDDFAHASPRTLQHHGDNVLATLRVLGNADLAAQSSTDATYFDVLGFTLVWWPQEWTLWMAIVSLVLLIVAARKNEPRAMTFGVLAAFAAILLAAFGGAALSWLARLRSETNFVATPLPSIAAMWLTGIAAALFGAALFNRRNDAKAMLLGIGIVWHMIGIALALTLPGAAFLFVVPAVAVTICALAHANETTTSAVAATVAAILFFPIAAMLYDALGGALMAAIALLLGACATLVAPLFARARYALVFAVLAIVAALIAMAMPSFDDAHPRTLPIAYGDDARATPCWIADEPLGNGFALADASLTPWNSGGSFAASAPDAKLARVQLEGTRNGNRVTLRVRTQRSASRLTTVIRGGTVLTVNGVKPAPKPPRYRERMPKGWALAVANGVSEMIVEVEAAQQIAVYASDATWGLPRGGEELQKARRASVPTTTIQDGDVAITRVAGTF